ncbi:MAG TPA: YfhO family protein, partial [Chloroflexia bacterium]|nr:YfhO family protein [Chloroflexia bacterium]
PESVVARRYAPQEVVIEVNAQEPGWVVLTDAWYPGWEATIDGRSVPVQIAYHAYRAVKVDAGQSTITMQFRPASWEWGRLITILSVLGVGAALVVLLVVPWWVLRRERARAASE